MDFIKKLLGVFLALCMLTTMLPVHAEAAQKGDGVTLELFTVSIDGGEPISLLSSGSSLNLEMGEAYTFKLRFSRTDEVKKAYVVSAKNNGKLYLEATDNGSGTFVTSGYFGNDSSYVPGTLSVEFSKTGNTLQEDIMWSSLQSPLSQDRVTITTNTAESVRGTADVSGLIGDGAKTLLDFSVDVYNEFAGTDIDLGIYKDLLSTLRNLEKGEVYCITPDENMLEPGTYVMFLKDASDANKYVKMALDVTGDHPKSLSKVSEALSTYSGVISLMADFVGIQDEKEKLSEQITKSPLIQNKDEAMEKLDSYVRDRQLFSTIATVLPVVIAATGGTMVVPGLIFTFYLSTMKAAADYFWDYRVGMIQGCDPIVGSFSEENDHPGWIALTKDYISEKGNTIQENGKYYLADSFSGFEVASNTHVTICLHGNTINGITIGSRASVHILDCKYKENKDNTIVGGTIKRGITIEDHGELIFDEGILEGNYGHTIVTKGSGAKITINGGTVIGINGSIIQDSGGNGKITINGGTLQAQNSIGTGIQINNSEVVISDGVINCKRLVCSLDSNGYSDGTIQVNGGKLTGNFSTDVGQIAVNMKSGFINGNISVKKVLFQDGTLSGNIRGEDITIVNGKISGNISGAGQINGGTIEGKVQAGEEGITITGGTISDVDISRGGCVIVDGGTITNGIRIINSAQLTISRGTVLGGISDNSSHTTILKIAKGSDIQVVGKPAFNKAPTIEVDPAYSGEVTYYSSPSAPGIKMSIQEAANIDFTRPYMRLVADVPPCTHNYTSTVTGPTCTERGYTTHVCGECGDSYQDSYTDALGHSFGAWIVTTPATAAAAGQRERTCSRCGYKDTASYPNWAYNDSAQTVTVSGAIPEDEQVFVAQYDPDGRFKGLEAINESKTVNVSGNKEILLIWSNKNTYIPICAAKRIFQ